MALRKEEREYKIKVDASKAELEKLQKTNLSLQSEMSQVYTVYTLHLKTVTNACVYMYQFFPYNYYGALNKIMYDVMMMSSSRYDRRLTV